MAYDEKLAERIREKLKGLPAIEEKKMMGGLCFMYHDKMCVGIIKNELMCRIDPAVHDACVEKKGCHTMYFTRRPMSGFIQVSAEGMKTKKEFNYWVELALAYNPVAKASKKKPVKK